MRFAVLPCILARPSDPLTRAVRCACQYRAEQRQPRPFIYVRVRLMTNHETSGTYHSQLIERPGFFDVLQRLLEIAQLPVDNALGLLGALHSLCLESLDSLDLPSNIVRLGLECIELLLDIVDNGGILENGPVVGEVDRLRLFREDSHFTARIVIALLEALESGGSLTLKTELSADPGPVELEGGAALLAVSFGIFKVCGPAAIERCGAPPKPQLGYTELLRI